ncbi:MAG: hypothetical protein WC419_04040, partial [Candidatus Omnitrophota bacterium]
SLGCGEAMQSKTRNDRISASYLAEGGAERMFARLNHMADLNIVSLPQHISETNVVVDGKTVGKYKVDAYDTGGAGVFTIVSTATVNNAQKVITVRYGYENNSKNGLPVGCLGGITMRGTPPLLFIRASTVSADGPLESATSINPAGTDPSKYVTYSGDARINPELGKSNFWVHEPFNTDGNSNYVKDVNHNGEAVIEEAANDEERAAFSADDINSDGKVDSKDAFVYYYTRYLSDPACPANYTGTDLGMDPTKDSHPNYYTGDQNFGEPLLGGGGYLSADKRIVFVNGNVEIVLNAQKYRSSIFTDGIESDIVVISTGNISIAQPTNDSNDRLTLIAYGNVNTGSVDLGKIASIRGNLVVWAGGDFDANYGGKTNGSIMANGAIDVNTLLPSTLCDRELRKGTNYYDWNDPAKMPLGLPPGFSVNLWDFLIKNEVLSEDSMGTNEYRPRWQSQ